METIKFILVCMLLLSPPFHQVRENLFNKHNNTEGASSVYISKVMMELNPNLSAKNFYIGKVAGHLNSVQVPSTRDNKMREEIARDIRSLVQSSRCELLTKQKETISGSEIYVNRKGNKIRELITVMDGASSLKFVYVEGDMTADNIKKSMLYQDTNQCFIISGDRLYISNKPAVYDNKKDISRQKGTVGLSGTYNLSTIDTNYSEELNASNDKLGNLGKELKNTSIE